MLSNLTVRVSDDLREALKRKVILTGYKDVSSYIRSVLMESLQEQLKEIQAQTEDFEYLL